MKRANCPFAIPIEPLEMRTLLSAAKHIEIAPDMQASQDTPKLRRPGAHVLVGADEFTGPDAPAALGTVEGITYNENATNNNGWAFIPPDPIGAAGPSHIVSVVNCSIEWHTKAGTEQNSQRLGNTGSGPTGSFFAPLSPVNFLFDPKVVYDQYAGRFVVVALEQQDTANGDPSNTSRILLAASDDSDPNGTWYYQAINSKINIGGTDRWADYPGLSVDSQAIYVTANMFGFGVGSFGGSRLWIVNKSGLYSGSTGSVGVYDPPSAVGQSATTMMPTHMYGTAPTNVGTFLVRYSGYSGGNTEYLSIIRVDNPLGSVSFTHQFVSSGNIDNTNTAFPGAPQAGTSNTIATNDRRTLAAVWRDNALWATATIMPASGTDSGQTTAHWWKVNTTNLSSLAVADQGNVGGEDIATGAYTFFPSITVDSAGNMGIGFSVSASSIYPSAAYTGRLATDAAGTVQPSVVSAAGLDFYHRAFGGISNRWGDYSGIALDPADSSTFWIFNEYALTRSGSGTTETGRWGTRWASFTFSAPGGISGTVYVDRNSNATLDGGEPGLSGWTIYLDSNNNNALDGGEPTQTTAGDGTFTFTGLTPGSYTVREVLQGMWIQTGPNNAQMEWAITVGAGATTANVNFGNFPTAYSGTGSADTYTVRVNGANTEIVENAVTYSIATTKLSSLSISPAAGNDVLTVESGVTIPVSFTGGDNDDRMNVQNGASPGFSFTGGDGADMLVLDGGEYWFGDNFFGGQISASLIIGGTPPASPTADLTVCVTGGAIANFGTPPAPTPVAPITLESVPEALFVRVPVPAPRLELWLDGALIPEGSTIDLGTVAVSRRPVTWTFTLTNSGTALASTGPIALPEQFALVVPPAATLAPGGSTTFTIAMDARKPGARGGAMTIAYNDQVVEYTLSAEVVRKLPRTGGNLFADLASLWPFSTAAAASPARSEEELAVWS